MKILPAEHAQLIVQAITAAQQNGDLPEFDMPTIEVRPPKRAEQGDYACAVAMQLAKPARMNPHTIATHIANHLPQVDFVGAVEVVHPGFINFRLNDDWLRGQVEAVIAEGDDLFTLELGKDKRAQVEFVSANPTGPLTVGRSRGAVVGDATARVLEAAGYDVEREYYFNDAGVQMRNLGYSLRLRYLDALGKDVEIPDEDDKAFYRGDYLADIAQQLVNERGDELADADTQPFTDYAKDAIFKIIRDDLASIDVSHDVFFSEQSLFEDGSVWKIIEELEERGHIYKAVVREGASDEEQEKAKAGNWEAATWFRSTTFGDTEDRVLVKSNGDPTYTAPDIAYHVNKLDRGFDLLVNVLGADHYTQAQVVRYGLEALGRDPEPLHVIMMQLVSLTSGRMSTRRGEFVTLEEVVQQTSPDVVRYFLLQRSADSQLEFDLDLAVQQSNENPVYYIQNAHVRCAGIFRQADEAGLSDDGADLSHLGEDELRFIRKLMELGDIIELSATTLEPHRVAFYAHELASAFHPIYENVRVLHSEVPEDVAKARLRFYRAARVAFKRVLRLMGMSAPETM